MTTGRLANHTGITVIVAGSGGIWKEALGLGI